MDEKILNEIVEIFLENNGRPLGTFEFIFTKFNECDGYRCAEEVKQTVLKQLPDRIRSYVDYHVMSRIVHPEEQVHATFIAVVRAGEAQVLLTSASLHSADLLQKHPHSASFLSMSEDEFKQKYVPASVEKPQKENISFEKKTNND